MPAPGHRQVYECDGCEANFVRRELRVDGVFVPLGSRAFEILEALILSASQPVTKDELISRVWPGAFVEDNTLQVHVCAVRKALGSHRGMLRTESGRGYRLLGSWTIRPDSSQADHVLTGTLQNPAQSSLSNIPAPSSGLIGRASAVQHLQALLSAYRIVTLTGPGGIGKTVLALEVARSLVPGFEGERRIVELASLSDPSLVASTVARVLGLSLRGDETSADGVARAIGERKLLLVLDNCEHVVDAASRLTEAIIRLCPGSTVLATSREVLRIDGEQIYRVPPLDVTPSGEGDRSQPLQTSAAELFVARVRALDPQFSLTKEAAFAIAAICLHLDGIPLAIEFAAARAATIGVQQVAAGLVDRFSLLTSGRRTALPRQQTLRATLDWSYDLLPESEAAMLRRLAIFAGHFTLVAATSVADDIPERSVVDVIANLVAKSLIVADLQDGTALYRLLETTRLYALDKLRANGEHKHTALSHAHYYRALSTQAEVDSETRTDADWLAIYGRHLDNWRAALDWAFSLDGDPEIGLVLTVGALPIWFKLSLMTECRTRIEQALAGASVITDPRIVMRLSAALAAASFYTEKGASAEIAAAWTKVLTLADRLADTEHRLWARWGLWNCQLNRGALRESLLSAQHFCDFAAYPADMVTGDRMVGLSLHLLGEQVPARQHLENVLARQVDTAARSMIRVQYDQRLAARAYLPRLLWLQGFPDQAMRGAESVMKDACEAGQVLALCLALTQAACPVALLTGDLITAERSVVMLFDCATTHGLGFWRAESRCSEGILQVMRGEVTAGLQTFRPAVQELLGFNTSMNITGFLAGMAGALAKTAEVAQGLAMVSDALTRSERDDEKWCTAELLRIRGECLMRTEALNGPVVTEALFRQSLELARQQGAHSWALRTATSLARLMRDQGRLSEARALLAPVYRSFSEGFETADLTEAMQVLDTTV